MPAILDVAIGTLFVFLLFSLIVSATVELLLALQDQRAKFLREGLTEMLGQHRVDDLLKHGLINALSKPDEPGRVVTPSYISPGAFVTAVFDLVLTKWSGDEKKIINGPIALDTLRGSIEALPDEACLRQSLLSLLAAKGKDIDTFRLAVEGWYNDAMDRVSGWYKKHSQITLLGVGFLLAIVLNVDTIHIVQTLSADPKLREAVIEHAEKFLDSQSAPNAHAVALPGTVTPEVALTEKEKLAREGAFQDSIARLGGLGIPFGWSYAQWLRCWPENHAEKVFRIMVFLIGCFITALAGSLGAPFWFDLLGRFMNVRAAGRSPIEKSATDSTPVEGMASMSKF